MLQAIGPSLIGAFPQAQPCSERNLILGSWLNQFRNPRNRCGIRRLKIELRDQRLTPVAVEKGTKAVISVNFSVYGRRTFNNLRTNFAVEIP
jgi:hypothetical protein